MTESNTFSIAKYIGEPENPALEAAAAELRSQFGRIEQASLQTSLIGCCVRRRMEWEAAKAIIAAYQKARYVIDAAS